MTSTLTRYLSDERGTLGELSIVEEGVPRRTFAVLERPWEDNAVRVSCIPTGTYKVSRWVSPSKGDCFAVQDVPDRTHILLHPGNGIGDSLGCLLPGLAGKFQEDSFYVGPSRPAMEWLLARMPSEWHLVITERG